MGMRLTEVMGFASLNENEIDFESVPYSEAVFDMEKRNRKVKEKDNNIEK